VTLTPGLRFTSADMQFTDEVIFEEDFDVREWIDELAD
jgi:hypothetical protein